MIKQSVATGPHACIADHDICDRKALPSGLAQEAAAIAESGLQGGDALFQKRVPSDACGGREAALLREKLLVQTDLPQPLVHGGGGEGDPAVVGGVCGEVGERGLEVRAGRDVVDQEATDGGALREDGLLGRGAVRELQERDGGHGVEGLEAGGVLDARVERDRLEGYLVEDAQLNGEPLCTEGAADGHFVQGYVVVGERA